MIQNSIILGVDPGYGRMGVAVIEKTKTGEKLIHSECFETDKKFPHSKRLLALAGKIGEIIETFNPQKMAIETLLWSKNKKTALQVAEARGVIISEAARRGVFISEHNPNEVKLAITGYGKSDKKQIIYMVEKLIRFPKSKKGKRYDDEYDAVAVALTCSAMPYPQK